MEDYLLNPENLIELLLFYEDLFDYYNEDNPAIFLPKGKSLKEYHLQIFDVWGGLLWETKELDETGSPAIGWDGTSKGAPAPQGTYVWKIHAIFSDGTIWKGKDDLKTGPIYLVR